MYQPFERHTYCLPDGLEITEKSSNNKVICSGSWRCSATTVVDIIPRASEPPRLYGLLKIQKADR